MTSIWLASVFLFSTILFAQQPTAPNTGQTPPPTAPTLEPASLAGRTLSLSGQPVRKTTLTLRPMDGRPGDAPKPYAATSDAEGKFVFESVEPGRYTLWAERNGYLRQSYGAKHSMSAGTPLTLSAGQHLKELTFQMTPQSVVSGKVVDDEGDPVGRSQIRVLKQMYRDGKRRPAPIQGGMSDESGEFKLADLGPGQYYICASPPNRMSDLARSASADPKKANAPEEDFVQTCYPSATDAAGAVPIDVNAGHDASGLEIRLRKSTVVHVKGRVAGAIPGRPYSEIQLQLRPADNDGGMFSIGGGAHPDKDGNFELRRVHPGSYRLTAMAFQGTPQTLGSQLISVGNENVADVTLNLTPPADLSGRITIENPQDAVSQPPNAAQQPGAAPSTAPVAPTTASVRISFYSTDSMSFGNMNTVPADDGSFTLHGISPAKYAINVTGLPDGAYLRSVRMGDQEAPFDGIDLTNGVSGELRLIVKMGAAQVDGTVRDDKSQPAAGTTVVLCPDPPQPEQKYLYRQTSTDQNGQFTLKNLNPGKYRVYAWEDFEQGAQYDPEFLKPHESHSARVSIDENGREQVNLTTISVAATEEAKSKSGR